MKKYSLPFVNDGKPFELPPWTVIRHEAAINKCMEAVKGKSPEFQDKELRFYVILESLQVIDDSVTIQQIKEMHVDDMLALFEEAYNAGKRGILFQEQPPGKSKKSKE